MKKINFTEMFIYIMVIFSPFLVYGDSIAQNDYVYFSCNNATSGELLGTTATLTCTDSADNTDVSDSLTNVAAGKFKIQFTNATDRYQCLVDCASGAVDYYVPIWVRTTPLVATDNIGINWADVSNPTTTVGLTGTTVDLIANAVDATAIASNAIDADAIAANAIGSSEIADNSIDAGAIAADAITSSELATSAVNEINDTISAGITSDHGTGSYLTATGFSTSADITTSQAVIESAILSNKSAIITQGDSSWITAVGFSTHSAADVWSVGTRDITGGTADTCTALTTNNDKTGYSLAANQNINSTTYLTSNLDKSGYGVTSIGTGVITADSIAANAITSSELATDSITALQLDSTAATEIAYAVGLNITSDHGTGLYNTSSSATISSSDIDYIAQQVWNNSITPQADRTINGTGITATATVNATQIWNEVVSCSANPTYSAGCILWSIERYI